MDCFASVTLDKSSCSAEEGMNGSTGSFVVGRSIGGEGRERRGEEVNCGEGKIRLSGVGGESKMSGVRGGC
ncbi:unnamed protein product [Linum trigynum]|uniref:Uncharacterized protein n=1 Tax=Linum trigynum TaxID=586398 RepID=A0AAV2F4D4_9ROSI